jgi:phosphoadenosine phosphosulfate reductase
MSLFLEELEQTAIQRIKKFAKIADAYKFDIAVGFSGGKDSQVVYDLCNRADVPFTAYYNVAFESPTTKKFIKEYYPEVIWRKDHKFGFIENIAKNHSGLLPTVQIAYCCADYKHNPKYVDKCSIIGVRRQESNARSNRTTISFKNKTVKKNMGGVCYRLFC